MSELIQEGKELAHDGQKAGLSVRLLGGVGVVAHCPRTLGGQAHREIADVDIVVSRADARRLTPFLLERDYEPETRFNAMHGDTRMIFHGPRGKLDVFVGAFSMCHQLDLDRRLGKDFPALNAADLLLTKLQIVELNAKDAHDASVLLIEHEIAIGDGDHIDGEHIARLTGDDWGLWRTVTGTLERLRSLHPEVDPRVEELKAAIERWPKSRRYKLRARVGERVRWYELPEETAAA